MFLYGCRFDVMRGVNVVLEEVGERQVGEGSNGRLHTIALHIHSDVVILVEIRSNPNRAEQLSLTFRVARLDTTMLRRRIVEGVRVGRNEGGGVTIEREGLLARLRRLVGVIG